MFIADTLVGDLIGLVVALLVLVIGYFKWSYQYWARRNVPYLEPEIPYGNLKDVLQEKEHRSRGIQKIYNEMKKRGWNYGGIYTFTKPSFFPIDLDIIKNVMSKDFDYFMDRDNFYNENDPLQQHLLNLTGAKWKNLRSKLSPTFTSGKMKLMFNIMAECQAGLLKRMEKESLKKKPIDIKEMVACFATNVIGSAAFGLEFNALEDENSEFRKIGRFMFSTTRLLRYKRIFGQTFPKIARYLNLRLARQELADFIFNMIDKTIEHRQKNNLRRNDFMQLLIDLKNNKPENSEDNDGKPLTMDEIGSQVVVFYAAGFETSSSLMSFAMYELAKHQDIQDRLRKEINSVLAKHNNEITYESVQDITYLSQVIDETFRLYPTGAVINRKCVKDYKIPKYDVVIEKGTTVTMSILGVHQDPEYYPNPLKFDPDRFSPENKKDRHKFAHLPFGEGPRNCIGMRFGLLQSKMGLLSLVKNYRFTINERTKEPLEFNPKSVLVSAKGGIWLNAERFNTSNDLK